MSRQARDTLHISGYRFRGLLSWCTVSAKLKSTLKFLRTLLFSDWSFLWKFQDLPLILILRYTHTHALTHAHVHAHTQIIIDMIDSTNLLIVQLTLLSASSVTVTYSLSFAWVLKCKYNMIILWDIYVANCMFVHWCIARTWLMYLHRSDPCFRVLKQ